MFLSHHQREYRDQCMYRAASSTRLHHTRTRRIEFMDRAAPSLLPHYQRPRRDTWVYRAGPSRVLLNPEQDEIKVYYIQVPLPAQPGSSTGKT